MSAPGSPGAEIHGVLPSFTDGEDGRNMVPGSSVYDDQFGSPMASDYGRVTFSRTAFP